MPSLISRGSKESGSAPSGRQVRADRVVVPAAEAHVGGNGQIRVLISHDGENWTSAALLSEDGTDLRDPKLAVTPDKRLMLVMGGSVYEGRTLKERQPRVAFSEKLLYWPPAFS